MGMYFTLSDTCMAYIIIMGDGTPWETFPYHMIFCEKKQWPLNPGIRLAEARNMGFRYI